jgi:hypothetical protein
MAHTRGVGHSFSPASPPAGGWESTEADAIDAARVMAAAIAEGDA